jgi:hypothetical protein
MSIFRSELNEGEVRRVSKGSRVSLSEFGRSCHPRISDKKGTVVGQTQYPNSLRIIWDGSRWPVTIHRDYLQLLKEEVSNADGRRRHASAGEEVADPERPRCHGSDSEPLSVLLISVAHRRPHQSSD